MTLPSISLVIPSYNSAETIERAVRSVLSQRYPRLELFLIDGGSKDETMRRVQPYVASFRKIISESDRGQAHALNKGFALARGDIFGWVCSDDELAPGALTFVAELFKQHPEANLLTGGCRRVFPDGTSVQTRPGSRVLEQVSYRNGFEQPSTFWRSELHHAAGEIPEDFRYAFDHAWWNELKVAGARLITTDHVLSHYHFSDSNKTSTGGRALATEMYRVTKQYGPLGGRLADVYMFLYRHFDLKGYYDYPLPRLSLRRLYFSTARRWLSCVIGSELVASYSWNFASKQERNLCWYK